MPSTWMLGIGSHPLLVSAEASGAGGGGVRGGAAAVVAEAVVLVEPEGEMQRPADASIALLACLLLAPGA